MFEAATGFDPGRLAGAAMARPFSPIRPKSRLSSLIASALGRGVPTGKVKARHSYHTPFGTSQIERRDLKGKGFFGALRGRALEARLKRDPIFRARFEAKVGGRYVPDGRNDGKITVRRFKPNILGLAAGVTGSVAGNLTAMTALGGLALMQGQAANLIQSLTGNGNSGSSNGLQGKPGSAVSKLGPGATFEDLVAAFMFDVVKEQQDEIKQKMNELDPKSKNNRRKKVGNFLKKLAPMAGKALGFVFGGPGGAMLGGSLGNLVAQSGQSNSASDTQSASDSRQLKMEELKNLMQKLQQMQQALSNVLNSMHQGAMNSIRNIRA